MNNTELSKIQAEATALLSDLGVEAKVTASVDKETGVITLQIESPEAAFLIGFHGETLQALQLILSFAAHKVLGDWVRVSVNVGDYRQKREEQLRRLALNLAMKVKFSGEVQTIPNLSAAERRIVHLALADHPEVMSQSEGEGRQRVLTIRPRA
jgi:spoIIIJ-associated protein